MFTITRVRPRHGLLRRRTGASLVAITTAALVSGLATAPVASSATSTDCPEPYPLASVTKGQPLTGLTVTSGTEPSGFTGEVLGVIDHPFGVAGMDIVMARLSSPEIDRVGVWSGMSGSPVYAADGRLVGAVALGLSWGPSTIAGITPAEEMYRLRTLPGGTSPRLAAEETVEIPADMTRRLVDSGLVPRAAAEEGLSPLPLPLGISGMSSPKRLNRLAKSLDLAGVRVHQAGAATLASPEIPVVAGGNLAASLSYGDVSAIGIGTATAVCGDQVIGFGHPMVLTGPSQMTMHGADALVIHEDPLGPGFKLANAGAPVGSITQDRWEGIFGLQQAAAIPPTTRITSFVEVPGEWSRTGTTRISVPRLVPDIAASHLIADQDRIFGYNEGSALVSWTISGRRADGRPWELIRTDRFANDFDVSFEPYFDLYDHLARLQFNEVEDISIRRIRTSSSMVREYRAYSISQVRVRTAGRWRLLRQDRPLFLRGGTTKRFRVRLTSAALGSTRVQVNLRVPDRIGRKNGVLEIAGGNSYYGGEFFDEAGPFEGGTTAPASFDAVLRELRQTPRNDQVLANLVLFRRTGTVMERSARTTTRAVVNGSVMVEVQGLG